MTASADLYPFLKPPTSDDFVGSLAHYRVLSELGRGGMGYVFRAEDTKLKRAVALKVMNQKISAIAGSRKRFISEARAMAAIHHDNVATIFEVGECSGTPFMAMEMLRGETLEDRNKRKEPLGFEEIIRYATDIARGLAAAHARGIVHRDIKPANIWIEADTHRIKILDFGLALASTPVDHLAGRGAVVGTPGYLSPEQARSDPLDDRSDLYSLGVVLYELCTGRIPIQSKSVHAQLISILAHRPTPIDEINPEIPKPLCDTIHRLLRKEPRSRFQSAKVLEAELVEVESACQQQSEMAQAINRLQEGLSQAVLPSDPGIVAADPVVDSGPLSETGAFAGIDEIPGPVVDPLAGIAVPAATPTRSARPRVGTQAKPGFKRSTTASPASKKTLPLIIAGATGLVLLLMILAWAFLGRGPTSETPVAKVQPQPSPTVSQPSPTKPAPPKPDPPKLAPAKPTPVKSTPSPQPPATTTPPPPVITKNSVVPKETTMPSVATSSTGAPANSSDSKPTPKPTPGPTKTFSISTGFGRGADAKVKKGSGDFLGAKPTLGVRSRGGIETNHTYLRFDLVNIKDRVKEIRDARLVLHVVGGKTPAGAELRLLGMNSSIMWPEHGIKWTNSASANGLQGFSPITQTTVGSGASSGQSPPGVISFGGTALTEYLQKAGDTVTFAIAGHWEERLLRFNSRERSPEQAPALQIVVPE